jgi:hypothetical protein
LIENHHHHHHQITKLSHSIYAIGPAPHRSENHISVFQLQFAFGKCNKAALGALVRHAGSMTNQVDASPLHAHHIQDCNKFGSS